ncbi:MAG: InlB B-repeat-containing protein [Lachnospiraceae bacterium]|nr:InlB B-repeat-containing protein [Lachnospiraceae bacterium]
MSKINREERYSRIQQTMEPLRKAKKDTIHTVAAWGRKYSQFRLPIVLGLFVFVFIYNAFYYALLHLQVRDKLARAMAIILSISLVLGSVNVSAYAMSEIDLLSISNEQEEITEEVSQETSEILTDLEDASMEAATNDESEADIDSSAHETDIPSSEEEIIIENPENTVDEKIEESGKTQIEESLETQVEEENKESVEKSVEEELEEAGFEASSIVDGIVIHVTADAGVFPVGSRLQVEKIVSRRDVETIEKAIADKIDEETPDYIDTVVEESYSFDIKIIDEEDNELEPDNSKGQVLVTFENVGVAEAEEQDNLTLSVFHVSDDLEQVEEVQCETDASNDTTSITAEHFSIYTVVITSGTANGSILQYYQGTSKANSYFTIYSADELALYKNVLEKAQNSDKILTILVNRDDANPLDGITGLGQATDMKMSDLNLNVKIMDDITVTKSWTPIANFPSGKVFDGNGHTIRFEDSAVDTSTPHSEDLGYLIKENLGTVKNILIECKSENDQHNLLGNEISHEYKVKVTVRVDGKKAEINEAITGAEAMAVSCDGKNYITLERGDDLAEYCTSLDNLEEDKEYDIYYVYENENETIALDSKIRKPRRETVEGVESGTIVYTSEEIEQFTRDLDYVSVTYYMEGANTYVKGDDGELSENVMSSVRVNKNADGSIEARESYNAILKAATGYSLPTAAKNITLIVNEKTLASNEFVYTYNAEKEEGILSVAKEKITGPMIVRVKARSLDDEVSCKVILNTKVGVVNNELWNRHDDNKYIYEQTIYQDTVLPTPQEMGAINGSDSIRFEGWYTNINCTGGKVNTASFVANGTQTYYAKWVVNKQENHNDYMYYSYKKGNMDVKGYRADIGEIQTTFGDSGFRLYKKEGNLPAYGGDSIDYSGTGISVPTSGDIFQSVGNYLYLGEIYAFDGKFLNVTFAIENRGNSTYTSKFNLGIGADTQIYQMDRAVITTPDSGDYFNMEDTGNKISFRCFVKGNDYGIDPVSGYWYGFYSSPNKNSMGWTNNVYNNLKEPEYIKNPGDSAMAFHWTINNIPAGGLVTKTVKIGMGSTADLNELQVTLSALRGRFAINNSETYTAISNSKNIEVLNDGRIKIDGNRIIAPPTRTSYDFAYWSKVDGEYDDNPAPAKFTGALESNQVLYAIWTPHPDCSLTNNSSVQKVKGSNALLVPENIANVVIDNTKVDGTKQTIKQGTTVEEAAGHSTDFNGTIYLDGADDRYLLPDDIEVTVKDKQTGAVTRLTRGTGYTYSIWNNRRKADLTIRKQYINGDITVTVVGYELPPVTATSIESEAYASTVNYGNRATFVARAETSKNHVATYQWYIAPYYEIELDNVKYWTYENQNGYKLENGVINGIDYSHLSSNAMTAATKALNKWNPSGHPITISGANKATLRIDGLDVSDFSSNTGKTQMEGSNLHFGGYHVYCVVTSTRNITGQQVVATSNVAELEVTKGTYAAPTGLEASATTYNGMSDGVIYIEQQANRPAMEYQKQGESNWILVTEEQIAAGKITGLVAGTYNFRYKSDSNNNVSTNTLVTVEPGRYILVTYSAPGADNVNLRTQYKHVPYGATVKSTTNSSEPSDGQIQDPARKGYTFAAWEPANINSIQADTVVNAKYTEAVYHITLNNQGADSDHQGSTALYEKYDTAFYKDNSCENEVNGVKGIDVPQKAGYDFLGYFDKPQSESASARIMINADGCASGFLSTTAYEDDNAVLYAHWNSRTTKIEATSNVFRPGQTDDGSGQGVETTSTGVTVETKPYVPEGGSTESETYPEGTTEVILTITPADGEEELTDENKPTAVIVYVDGEPVDTITPVTINDDNQISIFVKPGDYPTGVITFAPVIVPTTKENGDDKNQEEIKKEVKELVQSTLYQIYYKDVNGQNGASLTGTFISTAPDKGVMGVETELPTIIKTGYNFGGWYKNGRGTGEKVTSILPADGNTEVTVYALWTPIKYAIRLEQNGGEWTDSSMDTRTMQYVHGGEPVMLPSEEDISKTNYVFMGWYDNETLSGDPVTSVDTSQVGAVQYYARWDILPQYTITVPSDGHSDEIYKVESVPDSPALDENRQVTLYKGSDYSFQIGHASAYAIKTVKANGKIVSADDNGIYSLQKLSDNISITVVYEELVSTESNPNAVATILLEDGTTGYFDTLEEAIQYGTKYGKDSVIELKMDIADEEITIPAGSAISIDLNGHSITGEDTLLIESGAGLTIKDSQPSENPEAGFHMPIENRGTFTNGENIVVPELLNIGITNNKGTIKKVKQQESESDVVSKIVNDGTVENAVLESGYYVENNPDTDLSGISGYHTIANGNEYYVSVQDALDIAKDSDKDVTIKLLETLDNRTTTSESPLKVGNVNGKKITIDLNGFDISSGYISTVGEVEIANNTGSKTNVGEISATIHNTGDLTVGNHTKVSGDIKNESETASGEESGASVQITSNATVSGSVHNGEGSELINDGTVLGILHNNGDVVNNGKMNNIVQNDGSFKNNGNIETTIELMGGSYKPSASANPSVPQGGVVTLNTEPTTYYGTFEDAIGDIINNAGEQSDEVILTLKEDITTIHANGNDSGPLIIPSNLPITIDLHGHTLGGDTGSAAIQIGDGTGSGSGDSSENKPGVTFKNSATGGGVNAPITVAEGSDLNVDNGVEVKGNVSVNGFLENSGTITGGVNNGPEGTVNNTSDGEIEGLFTNEGTVENQGKMDEVQQNGGEFTNKSGGRITNITQTAGETKNEEGGIIKTLTQTGGNTNNEGSVETTNNHGGSYYGKDAGIPDGSKVFLQITGGDGENPEGTDKIYFGDLNSALNYAAGTNRKPARITLMGDIVNETINATTTGGDVVLDLHGHNIGSGTTIETQPGTTISIVDNAENSKGKVRASINNGGTLKLEGIEVIGDVKNTGDLTNEGKMTGQVTNGIKLGGAPATLKNTGTIENTINNSGMLDNEGTLQDVTNDGGTFTNEENGKAKVVTVNGGHVENKNPSNTDIQSVNILKGGYTGITPTGEAPSGGITGINVKVGDTVYGDLQSAIEAANKLPKREDGSDIIIELIEDVELPATPSTTIGSDNGNNIVIDLKGKKITGGGLEVKPSTSAGEGQEGSRVAIKNTETGTNNGQVGSPITVQQGGTLNIQDPAAVTGNVTNNGVLNNGGTISGPVTNNGQTTNNGTITGDVTNGGTVNNGGTINNISNNGSGQISITNDGTIEGELTINGGTVNNEGSVKTLTQNGGTVENKGSVKTLTQNSGTVNNDDSAEIKNLTQNGGLINNDGGIENATVKGGAIKGYAAANTEYDGSKAKVTDSEGNVSYYPTLQDALSAAEEGTTVSLLGDISDGNNTINVSNITLDLNGHSIKNPATLTNSKNATGTVITNTKPVPEEGMAPVINNLTNAGTMTVNDGASVGSLSNEPDATLENAGKIDTLTNKGAATNTGNGQITALNQQGGDVVNDGGNVNVLTFTGGSYAGSIPQNGTPDGVAQIGNKIYGDIDTAIRDANASESDVTIKVLKNTEFTSNPLKLENEQAKITLDLGGHKVGPADSVIEIDKGTVEISGGSSTDNGSIISNIKVNDGVEVILDNDTEVQGNVTNAGTLRNSSTIGGNVINTGTVTNTGEIIGNIHNQSGALVTNTGSIMGDMNNEASATFHNNGNNSYIGGKVTNAGTLSNGGAIAGEVSNSGSLTNTGNLQKDVENKGNGKLNNSGNINGQLTIKDEAATNNTGVINQMLMGGGKFTGNEPETIQGASFVATDAEGNKKFYSDIQKAMEEMADAPKPVSVKLTDSPVTVNNEVTIPEGVTLSIPTGKELIVGAGGSIENHGNIDNDGTLGSKNGNIKNVGTIENNGSITIAGGTLDNNSVINNNSGAAINNNAGGTLNNGEGGAIKNSGGSSINNAGNMTNSGDIENSMGATLLNNGTLNNNAGGEISNKPGATINNLGMMNNNGSLENEGKLENNNSGSITNGSSGEFNNEGSLTGNPVSNDGGMIHDTSNDEAKVVNKDGNIQSFTTLQEAINSIEEDAKPAQIIIKKSTVIINDDLIIPDGVTMKIPADREIKIGADVSLTNNGAIEIGEQGKLTVQQGGVLHNNSEGSIENDGTLVNSGELSNKGDISNAANATISNQEGGILSNSRGGNISNDGIVDNSGSLNNNGTLQNNASGSIQNKAEGIVNNDKYGSLSNAGTVSNDGTVNNKPGASFVNNEAGKVNNNTGSNLNNSGSLSNNGSIGNNGNINNAGNMTNNELGSIDNKTGGAFNNNKGGSLSNDGKVDNAGSINNNAGSTLTNNGEVNNAGNGTIENKSGASFGNAGTVNNGGKLENGGTLNNQGEGIIENSGSFNNEGSILGNDDAIKQNEGSTNTDTSSDAIKVVKNNGEIKSYLNLQGALNDAENGDVLSIKKSPVIVDGPITIPEGVTLNVPANKELTVVGGSITNNGTIQSENDGVINVDDKSRIENNGIIVSGGSLNNRGTLHNNVQSSISVPEGGAFNNEQGASVNNKGTVSVSGDVNNKGILNNQADGSMTTTSSGAINNENGGRFENAGVVENNGAIHNKAGSTLNNSNSIVNSGKVSNGGTLNNSNSGTIQNNSGADLNNEKGGDLNNAGKIANDGNVGNGGTVNNTTGGSINNNAGGSLNNNKGGSLSNSGTVENSGQLNNNNGSVLHNVAGGTIKNNPEATLENKSGASLSNNGTVNNQGNLENGGTLDNESSGKVNNAGVMSNDGMISGNKDDIKNVDSGVSQDFSKNGVKIVKKDGKAIGFDTLQDALDSFASLSAEEKPVRIVLIDSPIEIEKDITIPKDVTIEVPSGKEIKVIGDAKITNEGTLKISDDGYLNIAPEAAFENNGTLENAGIVNNKGKMSNRKLGSILNQGTGSIVNDSEATLNNNGSINNDGILQNNGTVTNNGIVNNEGSLSNSGSLANNQDIINTGVISNKGELENSGDLENLGTLEKHPGSALVGEEIFGDGITTIVEPANEPGENTNNNTNDSTNNDKSDDATSVEGNTDGSSGIMVVKTSEKSVVSGINNTNELFPGKQSNVIRNTGTSEELSESVAGDKEVVDNGQQETLIADEKELEDDDKDIAFEEEMKNSNDHPYRSHWLILVLLAAYIASLVGVRKKEKTIKLFVGVAGGIVVVVGSLVILLSTLTAKAAVPEEALEIINTDEVHALQEFLEDKEPVEAETTMITVESESTTETAENVDITENVDTLENVEEITILEEEETLGSVETVENNDPEDSIEMITIEVVSGMDSRDVAILLEEESIIENAKNFDQFLCNNGYDRKLRTGSFEIEKGASEEEIAQKLTGK